ncbi:cation diffusion facilitator family transporter [Pendulispora albinea]|uniref:Cation diffusion facilitator family transporter n=1 Tax=Pendulispora albinea TaxID=2741071 RepID=A0ABZ2M7Z8_9BACT
MSAQEHSTSHILQSLVVNLTIAATKAVAAVFTGSGAMLAEALHSAADCLNQLFLLIGVKQAKRKPDASHPLGYGRATYFWSFLVALMLFTGGGVFSIYEGLHKIGEPEPVTRVWLGIAILGFSLALEGYSTYSNIRELHQRRGSTPFWQYLRTTKDADLVVVFGENSAAVLGLAFALAALVLAAVTGDGRWDGIGSLLIGLVLVAVAIFLATEVKSLLLGESADPVVAEAVQRVVAETHELDRVLSLITLQQGPGEVLVAVKLAFAYKLDIDAACATINAFESRLRQLRPEVRWCFVEPDIPRISSSRAVESGAVHETASGNRP